MPKTRIVGSVINNTGVTLYTEDGKPIRLHRDNYRTNQILEAVAGPLARHEVAEIDLDAYSLHKQVEKKTGGLIRFIKEKVSKFVGLTPETGGDLDGQKVGDDETVVAVIGDKKIPGMQALEKQIERAVMTEDCKGFSRFMERLGVAIDYRGHSVQELLNFMKRADLPIADDGSIIAYKTLDYHDKAKGIFVDKHSKTVKQKLGSRVSMPIAAVDPSRRTQCSTGLHIARRGYLRTYYGDLLTLVKVAPEDVIAVPNGAPDKMRAAAYHIVYHLPDNLALLVRNNKPITVEPEGKKILAKIIAGDHVGVLEEVRIGEKKKGSTNEYDKEIESIPVEPKTVTPAPKVADDAEAEAIDVDGTSEASRTNVKSLNEMVKAAKESKAPAKKPAKKAAQKPKTPKPAPKAEKPATDAQKRRQEALKAVKAGMSQREAAKQFKVCAKTLRKMVREGK